MRLDNLLSRAKESKSTALAASAGLTSANAALSSAPSAKTILEETESAKLFQVEGEETAFYEAAGNGLRERLAILLNDGNVQSMHFTNDAAHIVHSKYGAMLTNIEHGTSEVSKMLKNFEKKSNFIVTTVRGADGQNGANNTILNVEKPSTAESMLDLVNSKAVSLEAASLLWRAVENPFNSANILVISPTAARFKVANALSAFIPSKERVACIGKNFVKHSRHWNHMEESQTVEKIAGLAVDRITADISNPESASQALGVLQSGIKGILTLTAHSSKGAWEYLQQIDHEHCNNINFIVAVQNFRAGNRQVAKIGQISEVIGNELRQLYSMENGTMVDKSIFGCEFFKTPIALGLTTAREIESDLAVRSQSLFELNAAGMHTNEDVWRAVLLR